MSAAFTASDNAGPPVAIRQRGQEGRVVDDGKRRGERAQVVFLAERVDAVLHADTRVVLRENRRGEPNQPDAAMGHRGRVADGVQHGPAADRRDVRVSIERRVVNRLQHLFGGRPIVLDPLPSGDGHDRTRQFERPCMIAAVPLIPATRPACA